jgi:succinate dehydrogenase hydrophobic anchor subunit
MGILEKLKDKFSVVEFLFLLTVIQFWWIAIWGIAYIIIDYMTAGDKTKEMVFYFALMAIVLFIVKVNPTLIEHF